MGSKAAERPMQPRLGRPQWDAECHRDVGHLEVREESKGENGPIVGRQQVEGPHQLDPVGGMYGGFEPGHFGRQIEAYLAHTVSPPRLIERRSNRQPSKPGRPAVDLTQAADVSPGSKEGFLYRVLRLLR
jgi:hypothetical protein